MSYAVLPILLFKITSGGGEITRIVVSVRKGFLFHLMLRIGCVIILWHGLSFHKRVVSLS